MTTVSNQELAARGLPTRCFVEHPSTKELVLVFRGVKGYYKTDLSEMDKRLMNDLMGITPVQAEAMLVGSLMGWDVPAADPRTYEVHEQK